MRDYVLAALLTLAFHLAAWNSVSLAVQPETQYMWWLERFADDWLLEKIREMDDLESPNPNIWYYEGPMDDDVAIPSEFIEVST